MKTRFLALALFIFTLTAVAQTQEELEAGAQSLYTNTVKGNYEVLMESTYPKLFDIVPKEKMLQVFKSMLDGDGYKMIIMDVPPNFKYGAIQKIEGGSYCLIAHDLKMKIVFDEKLTKGKADLMVNSFKKSMNSEYVTFDEAENSITVVKEAAIIGIADSLTQYKWKYLNKYPGSMMQKIVSPEVIKTLGL